MPDSLVKNVSDLLNEEKWTRATLNSYSIGNFKELDDLIAEVRKAANDTEVKELAEEHLKHSKNSIIALYLAGIISLRRQQVDDSHLVGLINIFSDNHKWAIVEYLCQRILEFGENKYALRTLAECYENENEQSRKLEIWERLIRVDYEEADIVRHLAERKEQEGALELAVDYYKKALHRFINRKMFSQVKDVWTKLLELNPNDIDFYQRAEKKVASVLSGERAAALVAALYPIYVEGKQWDTAIVLLKRLLSYDPRNGEARTQIIECYRAKYASHSQLEDYIRLSNLTQSWRNVHDAIADFEKHISFDKGNFVYHRSWGIGRIRDIKDDVFIIDFAARRDHRMSLKMAVGALSILPAEHIWVLKATMKREELREKLKSDPAWALKTVIRSFDNSADMKKIKAELVPDVLTASEWTRWNTDARQMLKADPAFGNVAEKKDHFVVRDSPITFEEKTFNRFKAETGFFGRVQSIRDFLEEVEPDSDYFGEMFSYFTGFLKSFTTVNEVTICSYLLVERIVSRYPYLNQSLGFGFPDLYRQVQDVPALFARIEDAELQREFLRSVERIVDEWADVFARLFRAAPTRFIIDELVAHGKVATVKTVFTESLEQYREQRDGFVWLVRNVLGEPWFAAFGAPMEKVYIACVHLLDITFREIENKREVSGNRKLNKQIQDFLFKEDRILSYLLGAGQDAITRLYTLVDDVKDLDPSIKIRLKQRIKEKHPDFKFLGENPEAETVAGRLIVTRSGYEAKQRALRHLLEVEVPQNSREIGVAMAKGDLRENAEYKAALEKQDLLNATAARLQGELQSAQMFDESKVDAHSVTFGTRVLLQDLTTGAQEEYYILGPWESDPNRKVISYLSPLGNRLYNRKLGEELRFTLNEREYGYRVDRIELVPAEML
jgi:transcription elongation factor GreA